MIVVGGESDARRIATEHDAGWIANIGGAVDASVDASHLWILREGVEPRPDALGSLVHAATQLDASLASPWFYLGVASNEMRKKPQAKAALTEYLKRCPNCGTNTNFAKQILRSIK